MLFYTREAHAEHIHIKTPLICISPAKYRGAPAERVRGVFIGAPPSKLRFATSP